VAFATSAASMANIATSPTSMADIATSHTATSPASMAYIAMSPASVADITTSPASVAYATTSPASVETPSHHLLMACQNSSMTIIFFVIDQDTSMTNFQNRHESSIMARLLRRTVFHHKFVIKLKL
jgi:hypothetical protein